MLRRPPRSTPTDTLSPSPTLVRTAVERERTSDRADRPARGAAAGARTDRHRSGRTNGARDRFTARRELRRRDDASRNHFPVRLRDCLRADRSEEHTSELQSLMRISYAVFCLKKKKRNKQ